MKRVSNTVQNAIQDTYAVLATVAAKSAVLSVQVGNLVDAGNKMEFVKAWLTEAGARATNWSHRKPNP